MRQTNLFNETDDYIQSGSKSKGKAAEKTIAQNEDMATLATSVMLLKRLDIVPAKVAFLTVHPNISKTTVSKVIKATPELKFFSGFDYLIEVSGEIWDNMDSQDSKILLEHLLRHILVIQNDKTGNWAYKLKQHDIQEFGKIASDYGTDWIKRIKVTLSSIYGFTPAEEDNIKI